MTITGMTIRINGEVAAEVKGNSLTLRDSNNFIDLTVEELEELLTIIKRNENN